MNKISVLEVHQQDGRWHDNCTRAALPYQKMWLLVHE